MKVHYNKSIVYTLAEEIICKIDALYVGCSHIPDHLKINWFEMIRPTGEYTEEQCFKDVDGYWKSNKKDCTDGKGNYTHHTKFIWRLEPNYCTGGRPSYSSEREREIYNKSETKKYLISLENFKVCLEWDGFDSPTETCWGLRMKKPYISIYENDVKVYSGLSLFQKGYKKHLVDFLVNNYSGEKK